MSYPLMAGRAEIICGIQTNDMNAVIRWLKNGRPIQRAPPTYHLWNGRVLVLMGFSASDNGQYTCVVNDGTMSTSSTRLQYQNPGQC